jgi:hypothetical protein
MDIISDLQAREYFLDFNLVGGKLHCAREKLYLAGGG